MDRVDVGQILPALSVHKDRRWAWENFLDTVEKMILATGARDVIEIGGGRFPSFSREKAEALKINYVSNDISERELSRAPAWIGKARFDIQDTDPNVLGRFENSFDVAFSKMVMEHVPSYLRAYRNIFRILRKGGVAIAFHPTLFASPFVVNKLMPERASRWLLQKFFPTRNDDEIPKFPAYYSGCRVSERVRQRIGGIGFQDVWQVPFYGHGYYDRLPIVRDVQAWTARRAGERNLTMLATFAFTIVRK